MNWKVIQKLSQHDDTGTIVELVENDDGRQFVVKRIQHMETPIYRTIFQKETQALSRLKACDNIVRIYKSYIEEENGEGIISMEYIPGKPLSKCLDSFSKITDRYKIVKQLSNAIRYAHQNSVIHRDINPSNILVTDDFNVKLIDFGISKIRGMIQEGTTYQYATQNFSAPEVAIHSENATEQSDIYSLGAVIYYLFTGLIPPAADGIIDAVSGVGGIDTKLKDVLYKMCALNPHERYENIDDCEVALSELYERYCGSDEKYYFAVSTNKIDELRNKHIVGRKKPLYEILDEFLPNQFFGGIIRKIPNIESGEQVYLIDGINVSLKCVLSDNIFHVVAFYQLDAYKKEQHKRYSLELPGKFCFISSHKIKYTPLTDNCNNIVINRIDDFQNDITNRKYIDGEYNSQYGIWRTFIRAMIDNASKNATRLYYTKVTKKDGLITFKLTQDSYVDDEFNQETLFVLEENNPKSNKKHLREIGTFLEYNEDDNIIVLKASPRQATIPVKGSICVDYNREIQQYRRQEAALEEFRRSETANTGNLKSIFVGVEPPNMFKMDHDPEYFNTQLDFTQRSAVKKVLEADDIALVQGPPGTGKTNVLVEVVRQVLRENERNPSNKQKILIVSQSHAAVDKILEDLTPHLNGITTIRIGNEENISEDINASFGLNHCQSNWAQNSVNKCKKKLSERLESIKVPFDDFMTYSQQLEELKVSNLQASDKEQLKQSISAFEKTYSQSQTNPFIKESLIMAQWIRHLTECEELGEYYIKDATIVAGTCIGFISDPYVRNTVFDYVIVDEAAKATLPEIMVALVRAHKVVLVGDHKQLPPVFDKDAIAESKEDIQVSSLQDNGFGKLFDMLPDDCKETLATQYRMHPAIGDIISQMFYDNRVQNGVSEQERRVELPVINKYAVTWVSTSSEGDKQYEKSAGKGKKGYINSSEITIIQKLLKQLDKEMGNTGKNYSVGVITPYRAQLELLKKRLNHAELKNFKADINTVDAFQGSQRDIIIYSTVRSSKKKTIGFLKEEARLNVSFSRAKCALIIVGDSTFLNNKRIRGNKFPLVQTYIQSHSEYCRIIDEKEIINAK